VKVNSIRLQLLVGVFPLAYSRSYESQQQNEESDRTERRKSKRMQSIHSKIGLTPSGSSSERGRNQVRIGDLETNPTPTNKRELERIGFFVTRMENTARRHDQTSRTRHGQSALSAAASGAV